MGASVSAFAAATNSSGVVGTAMFAYFALAGDVGCTLGPDIIGMVSDAVIAVADPSLIAFFGGDATAAGMKLGMLLATVFPIIACAVIPIFARLMKKKAAVAVGR